MLRPAGTWVLPPPLPGCPMPSGRLVLLSSCAVSSASGQLSEPGCPPPCSQLLPSEHWTRWSHTLSAQSATCSRDPKGPAPTAGPRSRGWGWGWGDSFLSPSVSPSSLGAPGSPLRGSALDLGITGWMLRVAWGRGIPGSGVRTGEGEQGPRRALMCPRAPPGGHAPPQVRAKAREGVPPPLGVPSHLLRPTAWARAWRAGGREGQGEGGESHAEVR